MDDLERRMRSRKIYKTRLAWVVFKTEKTLRIVLTDFEGTLFDSDSLGNRSQRQDPVFCGGRFM